MDPITIVGKWTAPIGLLISFLGGAAWLTTTHNKVEQIAHDVEEINLEYRQDRDKIAERLFGQDEKLSDLRQQVSAIHAKLDMMMDLIKQRARR